MRKSLIAAAPVAAVAVGTAGTALAVTHTTTGASNTISGCINNGVITYVHPRTATLKCPAGTTFINWNVTGPAGRQGPSGVVSTKTTDLGRVASVTTSYFGGSSVITLASATTLHVYAFGYDSDRGSGSYTLDDLAVTATQITPGS